MQHYAVAIGYAPRPDRRATAAAGGVEECALSLDLRARARVIDRGDDLERLRVGRAHLDCDRALTGRGWHDVVRQQLGDAVASTQSDQSGSGKDERTDVALVE